VTRGVTCGVAGVAASAAENVAVEDDFDQRLEDRDARGDDDS
jgi:hypothetical protein